jgi:tetratricopeptide (TPR) repeat protein
MNENTGYLIIGFMAVSSLFLLLVSALPLITLMGVRRLREDRNRVERFTDATRFNADLRAKKLFKKNIGFVTGGRYVDLKYRDYRAKKAAKIFKKIAEKVSDPLDKAYCLEWAGRCYELCGDGNGAVACYDLAVKIAPSYVFALNRLAYYFNDDYKQAEEYYKRSLEYAPTDASTYYNLGRLYSRNGEAEKAIEQYKTAIAVNNGDVAAMAETAIEYAKKGDRENCLKYYLLAAVNNVNEIEQLEEAITACIP